ncbi:MAG: succinyl-CoA--3-ketoacid-CoA transferase [Tenericutes bacterium HGW-Tenericutes-2]|jgi:acetate CoA/acetoacetate CoA-transferase beta subunit|nr:MAG: succinyl-CoA--3-ketoacid-CoA transferase [Tenericutes bacterium HGW-Tenericutes-2]
MDAKQIIAKRIAKELKNGNLVNLGIGIPTMVANYIPNDVEVFLQSENGIIGLGPLADESNIDYNLTNPSGQYATILEHGMFFDTALSFMMIRGGHLDVTVLGALEVDQEGSIASWIIPGKLVPGMGGSMDLVTGAKRVIIATTHMNKEESKIKEKCTLPLTGYKKASLIVTELAVMEVRSDGLYLIERHPDISIEEIISKTDAKLKYDHVKLMEV